MKYVINCWGSRTYPTWNYSNVKPSCEFVIECDEKELEKLWGFDETVRRLRAKVEKYLDDEDPDWWDLPFN